MNSKNKNRNKNDNNNLGGGDYCMICCLPCLFCWGVCEQCLKCTLMTLCCCWEISDKVSDKNSTEVTAINQNSN